MSKQYLIVGASGTVGSEIVRILKEQGHAVRTTTSKPTTEAGKVHVDLLSGEGLDAAFAGVDRAFFLSPGGYADQYQILGPLVRKAKEAKLEKVVLMTAIGVDGAPDEAPLRHAELDLIASGVPYNIIRPSWFMQNFNTYWVHGINVQGKISLPAGDGKAGFIDTRDISAVAAALLVSDEFNNEGVTITGPEALDHNQIASLISEASGKKVVYEEITPETFKAGLLAGGVNEPYAELLTTLMSYIKAGYTGLVNDSVRKILGREPGTFKQYAHDFAAAWK